MPAPKGTKPPNMGKGRRKGSLGRVHRNAKAVIDDFIAQTAPKVPALWDRLAEDDPRGALEVFAKLADFVMPRLSRAELQVEPGPVREPPSLQDLYSTLNFVDGDGTVSRIDGTRDVIDVPVSDADSTPH